MNAYKYLCPIFFLSLSVFADNYPIYLGYSTNWGIGLTPEASCEASKDYWVAQGRPDSYFAVTDNGTKCRIYYTGTNVNYAASGFWRTFYCPYGGTIYGDTCVNSPSCPDGQFRDTVTGQCMRSTPKMNGPSPQCGVDFANPINAATGNKWLHETDIKGGVWGLSFARFYNKAAVSDPTTMGAGWRHTYQRTVVLQAAASWVAVLRQNGKAFVFHRPSSNSGWLAEKDVADRLVELKNDSGQRIGWRYTTADATVET